MRLFRVGYREGWGGRWEWVLIIELGERVFWFFIEGLVCY